MGVLAEWTIEYGAFQHGLSVPVSLGVSELGDEGSRLLAVLELGDEGSRLLAVSDVIDLEGKYARVAGSSNKLWARKKKCVGTYQALFVCLLGKLGHDGHGLGHDFGLCFKSLLLK